jgi:hypothetical protein
VASIAFAPRPASAATVRFVGVANYTFDGNVAVLTADQVQNFRPVGISGTLYLELWAFPSPYSGSLQFGFKMAQYWLGQVSGGSYLSNLNSGPILFVQPPNGVWYFTLALTEYVAGPIDNGFIFDDYVNFSTPVTFGPPPPPGQLQGQGAVVFPPQQVGTESAPTTVTITNVGGQPVTVASVQPSDLTEFHGSTNCVTIIAARANCQIVISFQPTAVGLRSETIVITSDGVGSPQSFSVSGSGSQGPALSNYQGLWWAAPAGSESGWGINFAHQGNTIFASWFTYDLTGKGLWLVMTAVQTAPNTYSGTLYSTTGPAFNAVPFNPTQVAATQVGTGTLTFSDAYDGTFAYTVNGVSQVKNITREVFGNLPSCATATGPLTAASNYTDLWWASPPGSESGWGINLTHEGATIFATWFTYALDGTPMWLVVAAANVGPGSYSGTLYQTTGPAFDAVPFSPAKVVPTAVGAATFAFADGNNATFAYTVNGISQHKAITREVFAAPGTVCQ